MDAEMLERFAKALKVPVEYLETLEEDAQTVVFENITNNDQAKSVGYADVLEDKSNNNFSPIDKITELYERLLKEKDEKYTVLESRIHKLEQRMNEK